MPLVTSTAEPEGYRLCLHREFPVPGVCHPQLSDFSCRSDVLTESRLWLVLPPMLVPEILPNRRRDTKVTLPTQRAEPPQLRTTLDDLPEPRVRLLECDRVPKQRNPISVMVIVLPTRFHIEVWDACTSIRLIIVRPLLNQFPVRRIILARKTWH